MKTLALHYQENSEASDNLLFCLHGNSVDSNYFQPLLQQIEGWKVVAPDYLGHGNSPRLTPNEYNYESFIQCLLELLSQFSYKKLVIVGHSMGGNLAVELMKVTKVDGIVLMTSAPISYTSTMAAYLTLPDFEFTKNHDKNTLLIEEFLRRIRVKDHTTNYLKEAFLHTDPVFRDRLLEELNAGKFSDHLEILKLNRSTTVGCIVGLDDMVANNDYMEKINEEGIFHSFKRIAGAGHYSLLEKPQENIDYIIKFLTSFA